MAKQITIERKSEKSPDETRTFDKGRLDVFNVGGTTIGIGTFQPGWKWSECVKPIVKTTTCEIRHLAYVLSGQMKVVSDDGTETTYGPGDIMAVAPGHDAWIVGGETCRVIDFLGAPNYAKR
jgi:uncharacterized cupin superfamily protein